MGYLRAKISAKIRGNINPYFGVTKEPLYTTTLALNPISAKQWDSLMVDIGNNAGFICKLMMNEMPDDIEKPFKAAGLGLLPLNMNDFTFKCSCPDYAVPCKHIAGVFYRLAAQLDHQPLLLFQLRGLSHQKLHQQLAKTPLGKALLQSFAKQNESPPLRASYYTQPIKATKDPALKNRQKDSVKVKAFWQGKAPQSAAQPEQIEPWDNNKVIPALIIKKGGDYPAFWPRDNSFIEAMEAYYQALSKQGQKLL